MEKLKFGTLIEKSIARTKNLLLNPFSFKKWMVLLFIAYMAGALGGGMNFNYRGGGKSLFTKTQNKSESKKISEDSEQEANIDKNQPEQAGEFKFLIKFFTDKEITGKEVLSGIKSLDGFQKVKPFLIIIGVIIFAFFCLVIVFTWLYSRFLFVWFDAIIKDSTAIVEPFKRYKKQGQSIFKILLFVFFLNLISAGLFLSWFVNVSRNSGIFSGFAIDKLNELFNVFKFPLFTMIAYFVIMGLLNFFITRFIIVFMAIKQTSFWPGVQEFIRVFKENIKDIVLFVFVSLFLGIAIGIIYMIVLIVSLLAIGLIGAGIFGALYFLIAFLLKMKLLFTILAVIIGLCLALLAALYFSTMGLPFAVFFENFLLYFITNLNCGYQLLELQEEQSVPEDHPN